VEEELSEEEKLPRGRSSRRVEAGEVVFEERRPLSPLASQSAKPRSRSSGRHERYGIPRKPVRQQRVQETIRQLSLSPRYQYVQAPAASKQIDPPERAHPRRIPIHFVEDDVYESVAPARAHQTVPIRECSFEERESGPSRSQGSSQRRRRERLILNDRIESPLPPWEGAHVIHPRPGDEAVVVTERYVYRPRNLPLVEEERRMQERVDKIMLGARSRTAEYTTEEEASRYYHDDWAREEPDRRSEPVRRREPRRRGYRREVHQDSELAGSEDSLDYARIGVSKHSTQN
jgi:hypothetical protein